MEPYHDYPSVTKIDKSRYNSIKKGIFLVSQKLGSGTASPVPYDTAWVARIPEIDNSSSPAFPECLQWLRDHQREDGSWGEEHPCFLHSKILNTFTAALVLSQWNYPEDTDRKKRALEALTILDTTLQKIETDDKTFEMLISGLMDDARELKLEIPCDIFEWHTKIGKDCLRDMESKIISNKPSKYWALLEATSRTLDLELECFRSEITENGLIAAQPSTTAYILRSARLRGINFPEAEWTLEKLCVQNKGGVPHLSPCDNFEIIHGLDFLFKVDINPRINVKHSVTKKALNVLRERLGSKSEIGFSSVWQIPDDGCSETALRILRKSLCVKQELKGDIITDKPENGFSLSTNSKPLFNSGSLKNCASSQETDDLLKPNLSAKMNGVSKAENYAKKSFLSGIWNVSVYSNVLQTVVASQLNDTRTVFEIAHFIGKNQNNDGGWGGQGASTVEETTYVCLTVFHLVQKNSKVLGCINFAKLDDFMNSVKTSEDNKGFWCYKVIFQSKVVSETVITAAKHAIFQIQRICAMTNALNDNQLDFLDIKFFMNEQLLDQEYILFSYAEVRRNEIEVDKQEVTNILNSFFAVEFHSKHMKALIDINLELTYCVHPVFMPPYERAIETLLMVLYYLMDDIFDYFLQGRNNLSKETNELLRVVCKILRGDYPNIEAVPTLAFPRFSMVSRGSFHYRKMMEKKHWNAETYVRLLERDLFKAFADDYKLKRLGVELTAKMYLHLHKHDCTINETTHQNSRFHDSSIDSTEFYKYELFVKYNDHCCKALRLSNDLASVLKEVIQSESENYCLSLQEEYKISLREAMTRVTSKTNKEILKMYLLKHMILKDPVYGTNKRLLLHMKVMEKYLFGGLLWSLETPRYLRKTSTKRLHHTEKDLKFIWELCFRNNQ